MDHDVTKHGLRKSSKAALSAMSEDDRRTHSARICALIEQLDEYKQASTILVYAALGTEVDLDGLMVSALESGKRVCVPRVDWDAGTMVPTAIMNLDTDLVVGRYGVRSPGGNCERIPVSGLEMVVVPGLAFDCDGGRLGRGKGFYDRLLVGGALCPLVGVCFSCQVVGRVPMEAHDRVMDRVVCEQGVLRRDNG
ncbi:MAG: 5-formyltetrahydrofolate cyclo-ligase [Phycisphaerales bacterium]|nr:5-formyltetrahydrofolate cyclo-ligase [Phycisphaerales bacterium]